MSTFVPPKPREPDAVQRPEILPQAPTLLISKPGIPVQVFSANRETDSRTAIKRGLKEYISQLSIEVPGGREVRLFKVFDTWAEQDEHAVYPSAVVYFPDRDGIYDASGFTPSVSPNCVTPNGDYLVKTAEMTAEVMIETYSTDPEERIALAMMLEDALNPVDWMYGFQLELPHYFNTRAKYELLRNRFPDTETAAFRRNRIGSYTLSATIPVVRLVSKTKLPPAQIKTTVIVTDGNEDC